MRTIHLEHEIACDEDAFWNVFLDHEYTTRLFREVLGFPYFDILEQAEADGVVRRECAAQPKLPAAQMAPLGPRVLMASASNHRSMSAARPAPNAMRKPIMSSWAAVTRTS